MKWKPAICLPLLTLLLTGCPHNQYIVELTPRGKVIERKLVFYREDGTGTNDVPNYQAFPLDELVRIQGLYSEGSIKKEGERRTAAGQFASVLPADVGGTGSYTSLTNTLGGAAFYMERFRGDDDLAGRMAKRSHQMDQLVDLVIGWSRKELGGERRYQNLRRFLDEDFRQDMRNLSFYIWMVQASATTKAGPPEEFAVRFGQYLVERGYLQMVDLPKFYGAQANGDWQPVMLIVQRLLAAKLAIPKGAPMSDGLKMLADPDRALKSWTSYLETTDLYRAKLRQWQKEKIKRDIGIANDTVANFLTSRTNTPAPPAPAKPDPTEVATELTADLLNFDLGHTDDHLAVRLSLPAAPLHTNGKWDEVLKQVDWDADLDDRTNTVELPTFCYAAWCDAAEAFQKEHFGKVALKGDELLEYCVWRAALNEKQAAEWEAFLLGLKPGEEFGARVDAFQFSVESSTPAGGKNSNIADRPRKLIKDGYYEKPPEGGK